MHSQILEDFQVSNIHLHVGKFEQDVLASVSPLLLHMNIFEFLIVIIFNFMPLKLDTLVVSFYMY